MPNQRVIAQAAGVTQATVSMAMRGDPAIPESTRQHVRKIAETLGYRPNAYVSTLMAHIRSGRPPRDKGCIAILIDSPSEAAYDGSPPLQCKGMEHRATALGFQTEQFFLGDKDPTMSVINRVLQARGINGVILAAGSRGVTRNRIDMDWPRYAVAAIAYTWPSLLVDSVASHHRHSVNVAFDQLINRGYKRIGMCLPPNAVDGVDSCWLAGYYIIRHRTRPGNRIPLFTGTPAITPFSRFSTWFRKWKPDAIVCIKGHETEWLERLGVDIPDDIGLVCINRPLRSHFSGLEERHETIGAATTDLVVQRIYHNEYGLPPEPKLILIEGHWHDGETLQSVSS